MNESITFFNVNMSKEHYINISYPNGSKCVCELHRIVKTVQSIYRIGILYLSPNARLGDA